MAIENLAAVAGPDVETSFYRTSGGAEIDLVLSWPSGREWAIEVKRSLAPKLERGFHSALADLGPSTEAIGLADLCGEVSGS